MPDSPDLQLFLSRLTARSVLSDEEQQAILSLPTHTTQVQAHRDFVHLGRKVDHCSLIVDGVVGRFGDTRDGRRQITALHVPGDMADLHSLVRPVGTSSLQALSTTTIQRVPHTALRALTTTYPAIAEALWRDCMVDAAVLSQWVVNVGRRDSQARLAHLFCEMAIRFGDERQPLLRYPFPLTQAHLADATGLTAVHINRTLKALRTADLVSLQNREVQILDWDGLAGVGEFDATYLQADVLEAQAA